jgi:hypothetical protein
MPNSSQTVEIVSMMSKLSLRCHSYWYCIILNIVNIHNTCLECVSNTKEVVSASGRVVEVLDRHIPTIKFFLRIWIPKKLGFQLIHRSTWYEYIRLPDKKGGDTIKDLDENMKARAEDIVANEGRGIFYAKNRLGMHDRQQIETKNVDRFDFDN